MVRRSRGFKRSRCAPTLHVQHTQTLSNVMITPLMHSRRMRGPSPAAMDDKLGALGRQTSRGARRFSTRGFSSERVGRPHALSQMPATALAVRGEDARCACGSSGERGPTARCSV